MYEFSGELIVILIGTWWCKNKGKIARCKQAAQKFDGERLNLKKLSEVEVRKRCQINISYMFAALENINVSDDINRAWRSFKANSRFSAIESLGLYELKRHKPWFDEECLRFLDERKQTQVHLYWIQIKAL
jgi:hypothetical protein